MYVRETDYLLRKGGRVNCARQSFPLKRWMNKYMGLMIQIGKKDTYVFVMSIYMTREGDCCATKGESARDGCDSSVRC